METDYITSNNTEHGEFLPPSHQIGIHTFTEESHRDQEPAPLPTKAPVRRRSLINSKQFRVSNTLKLDPIEEEYAHLLPEEVKEGFVRFERLMDEKFDSLRKEVRRKAVLVEEGFTEVKAGLDEEYRAVKEKLKGFDGRSKL